jgi:hypothetical protein
MRSIAPFSTAPFSKPPRKPRRRTTSRVLAAVAALLVVPALVLATPGTAGAVTTGNRADAGAGWLGRQLGADHLISGAFGPDYGLTADVVLALDSAGVGKVAARSATKALKANVANYTGFGDPNEFYAGAFAKLLNVAAAQHANPRAFGSSSRHDLVGILRFLECGQGNRPACASTDRGRFSDISAFGDFSNTLGQSLALIGLERTTKAGPSTPSIVYLRHQQCASGAFPVELSAAGCIPSVDATAFAVQALLVVGGRKAHAAAQDGARWLARHQHANGSFTGNDVRNTNSTGLATQALRAAGRDQAAAKGAAFIRSLQFGCGAKPANRGKVRYDKKNTGEAVRSTPQAVPALAGVGLADVTKSGALKRLPTLRCS